MASYPPLNGGIADDLVTLDDQDQRRIAIRTEAPDGIYGGNRAMTVQFYTEANVKSGKQFEASTYTASFPGFASSGYIVRTGSEDVVLKGRTISVSGLGLRLEMFVAPTYTGGTPIPVYTLNHRNSNGTTVQILASPTVTSDGIKVACDKYIFGSNLQGGSAISSSTLFTEAPGLEMVLPANSVFYFKSTSLDNDPQRVFSYNTWYEGDTDLPLP
jgi:hypothetical protein